MIAMALVQDIYIFFTFHLISEHGYLTTLINLYLFVVLIGSDSICVESNNFRFTGTILCTTKQEQHMKSDLVYNNHLKPTFFFK